jgi:UDP-N-acetylmuramoylalanine-D-glutamate ligase
MRSKMGGTYVAEHVCKARGRGAFAVGAIGAGVFGFLLAEVQEDFVVGEEGGLGSFDLGWLRSVLFWKER